MHAHALVDRPSTVLRIVRDVPDRAAKRRAFGIALLHAWRTLGQLVARNGAAEGLSTDVVDRALDRLEALREALLAMRDGGDDPRR